MTPFEAVLAGLRVEFLGELPGRLDELKSQVEQAIASADPAVVRSAERLAHNLRGTAASYRVPAVARLAGDVEAALGVVPLGDPRWQDLVARIASARAELATEPGT